MTDRVVDEWVGGHLPDEWLPPRSLTGAGPALRPCGACGHVHGAERCAYTTHDGLTGVTACGCTEDGRVDVTRVPIQGG